MENDVVTSNDHVTKSIGCRNDGAKHGEQVLGCERPLNKKMMCDMGIDRAHDLETDSMQYHRQQLENTRVFSPHKTCNNMNQNFNSEQSNTDMENGLSFFQNKTHTTPTVHFRENTSSRSDTGNFNNSQVHGQGMFAHGNNWGTYGCDKSYNQLRGYGNNTVRTNRKLKEPDVFDGQRTEWPDFICHFEQVAQWNYWSESKKAAQLAMSLRGIAQRVLRRYAQYWCYVCNVRKRSSTER
ncbi:unnamed protein product [Mytilus coruscus]|uniref:Uncharacterized protein n=1 Tax=Mytilus coruscus TaxID=42192 RepID=A0A6J8B7E8_MYTCO|nr:unnamed protein product [Mytilus coruscus]